MACRFTLGLREAHWQAHVRHLLCGMELFSLPPLLLDSIAAQQFVARGLATKQNLIEWVIENATMPATEFWDLPLVQNYIYPRATFSNERWASHLQAGADEPIPMFRLQDINVVIVGGETNGYWRIMGGSYQKTVCIDDWR